MKPTIDMMVSPLDRGVSPKSETPLVQLGYKPTVKQRWVPSLFNARTVGDDGRLILWNTFSGAISVFQAKDRERVLAGLDAHGVTEPLNKAGEYLSRRGFLVREESNELDQFRYFYAQQHWRTDTLQLILLSSEDCNFRCVYCYEKFKNGTMRPEVRQGVRSLILQRAPFLRELSMSWFGGEPLYGWEALEELAPFAQDVARKHGLAHTQNITTNAYLLTEDKATKLLEWDCRNFQITIDGVAEDHDCKRVGRDGSPTHAVILENLRAMKARKDPFQITIRVNFDQENVPKLGTFLEALSEDFAGDPRFKVRFRAIGKWGGPNDDSLSTCGVSDKRKVVNEMRKKAEEVELAPEAGILEIARAGSQVCYAARPYNFIVSATGKLMKCTVALDDLEANMVGQLHPDGRLELNHENMAKWVNPHFESDSMCKSCYVLPGCQGVSCPLPRITHNERSCCSVKSTLKSEMKFTLSELSRVRTGELAGAAS
jgi:uncharacterized protein